MNIERGPDRAGAGILGFPVGGWIADRRVRAGKGRKPLAVTVQVNGAAQPPPCRIVLLTPAGSTDSLDAGRQASSATILSRAVRMTTPPARRHPSAATAAPADAGRDGRDGSRGELLCSRGPKAAAG